MAASFNFDLVLAVALVAVALGLFVWQIISTARRAGLAISEGTTPRRYILLGLAAGFGAIYLMRR